MESQERITFDSEHKTLFLDEAFIEEYESGVRIENAEDRCVIYVTNISIRADFLELLKYYRLKYKDPIVEIHQDVILDRIRVKEECTLENCIFKGKVSFVNAVFDNEVLFGRSFFHDELILNGSDFEKSVRFHGCQFSKGIQCVDTTFVGLADFYEAEFLSEQLFERTDFLGITVFSNTIFREKVTWLYNKVSSDTIISFESAEFEQALDISRANFFCRLRFWNVQVHNPIPDNHTAYSVSKGKSHRIENGNQSYEGLKTLRESYRIIKQEFLKEGNSIDYLRFKALEMKVYERELVENLFENKSRDRFILWLSKISNKFGQDWLRALGFTLFVAFITHIIVHLVLLGKLSLVTSGFSEAMLAMGEFFKVFVVILNVTNWKFEFYGLKELSPWIYPTIFIGRIFIGFGIYQMISAFRKFNK